MSPQANLPKLHELITRVKKCGFEGILCSYDPGETTGFSVFLHTSEHTQLLHTMQLSTWPIELAVKEFYQTITIWKPSRVVYEVYHVYKWRLEQHTFSEVPTIQIIGCLKTLCIQQHTPYFGQTAQVGKGFMTDRRLQEFDLYHQGRVHSRDSMRHACQHMIFGEPPTSTPK